MTSDWFAKKYKFSIDNKQKSFATTDTKKKTVKINKKKSKSTGQKGELLDTINHEILHTKHPKKSEAKIIKMTRKSTPKLSKKTKVKMYKLLNH